jgi:transposase
MALGKRRQQREQELFIPTTAMPRSPGHPFYQRLNRLLAKAGFDEHVEELCQPHYADVRGRPSIPPGVYFRMLLVGYFEGIDSQRGIAWRCADSRSLQEFLGLGPTDRSPEHSSLTRVRQRLPLEVHQEVFGFVVAIAKQMGLLKGKTLAVDTTTLEANAAMKSIVRRDSGDGWNDYVRGLAEKAGIENPSDDDLRRFDRGRRDKKVSNRDWESPTDPDARIGKMKDGRTKLGYKAQHAIDLDTDFVVAATIHHADESDAELLKNAVVEVGGVLASAGHDEMYEEVVADKGYHKAGTLAWLEERRLRSYIPERRSGRKRRWRDKPAPWEHAFRANRRRSVGPRAKDLHRRRSERVERSFAHVCRTGAARRTWLRGIEDITKRYVIHVAGRNLGTMMRAIFGVGTPRGLQGAMSAALRALLAAVATVVAVGRILAAIVRRSEVPRLSMPSAGEPATHSRAAARRGASSTT